MFDVTAHDIIAKRSTAHREAVAIHGCSAFNVTGYASRRKLNQHATLYRFPDESRLLVTSSEARAETLIDGRAHRFTTTHSANTHA